MPTKEIEQAKLDGAGLPLPEVAAKLKEPRTTERKFEEVVKDAEQAAGLVLAY